MPIYLALVSGKVMDTQLCSTCIAVSFKYKVISGLYTDLLEDDTVCFAFESAASESFFLVSSQTVFTCDCHL